MTNREKIEREGYMILFIKKATKFVAIARKDSLHVTAEGRDQVQALARLRHVVSQMKGGPNG